MALCRSIRTVCNKIKSIFEKKQVDVRDEKTYLTHLKKISNCTMKSKKADIIFVHGLGGDAIETWKSSECFYWPQELANELDIAEIWSLNYNASPIKKTLSLPDLASNIIAHFEAEKIGDHSIIFICHSLGGLLVKQILRNCKDRQDEAHKIYDSIKGVAFLATPHAGSLLATGLSKIPLIKGSLLFQALDWNDSHLSDLNLWFRDNFKEEVVVYFETLPTRGVFVVDPNSSDPGMCGVRPIPMETDHIAICKPISKGDLVYIHSRGFIERALSKKNDFTKYGVETWEYAWASWAKAINPSCSTELAIGGRDKQVEELISKVKSSPTVIRVNSNSIEDAYGFILAALSTEPSILPRVAIIRDERAWHKLLSDKGMSDQLVLVNCCNKEMNHGYAVDRGHYVVFVSTQYNGFCEIKLPMPNRILQIEALNKMRINLLDAERIVRSCRGRTSLIRRHKDMNPREISLPNWVTDEYVGIIVSAIFAEAWRADNKRDCDIVASMANMDYEQFEEKLERLVRVFDDSPVRLIGKVWSITSRQDALLYLKQYISSIYIKRLCSVALQVLQQDDPLLDISPEERWKSFECDNYSEFLSKGISSALAMVVHEFEEEYLVSSKPLSQYVSDVVSDIFCPTTDYRKWYSLRKYISFLAEASPEVFLKKIEDDLKKNNPEVTGLFIQEGTFGGFPHANILWALELVSWNRKYFSRVVRVLASLSHIELNDRVGNRPFGSLSAIFKPWNPQTSLKASEQIQILEQIYLDEPTIVWKLLLKMLPKVHDYSSPIQSPAYADWHKDWQPEETHEDEMRQLVQQSILSKVNEPSGERWTDFLVAYQVYDEKFANGVLKNLQKVDKTTISPDCVSKLNGALYELVSKHRRFPEAKWVFPKEYIDALEDFREKLVNDNLIEKYAYLFNWGNPYIAEVEELSAQQEIAMDMRLGAIKQIWTNLGNQGIVKLARVSKAYTVLTDSLARCKLPDEFDFMVFEWLSDSDLTLKNISMEYIFRRSSNDSEWLARVFTMVNQWESTKQARFFSAVPFNQAIIYLEQLHQEARDQYWGIMEPAGVDFQNKEQVNTLLNNLLSNSRALAAACVAKMALEFHRHEISIDDKVIFDILVAMAKEDKPDIHAAQVLIKYLQERCLLPKDTMLILEWEYLPVLDHSDIRPSTLITDVVENPASFTYLLRLTYRPSVGLEEPDLDVQNRDALSRAYTLLRCIDKIPGQTEMIFDKDKLVEWIDEVRHQAAAVHRLKIADYCIGELLANVSKGNDGVWPNETIREVIEYYQNSDMERGLFFRKLNRRGATSRGIFDGGIQENTLSSAYAQDAEKLKYSYPRTARLLICLSENYLADAKRHDVDAEIMELKLY